MSSNRVQLPEQSRTGSVGSFDFPFMLLCAGTALTSIWFEHLLPEKLIPTFFIVGFASFLIWAPTVVYKFYAKLR